jgi:nicotinate-nucleotide adenylyltransferase
LSDSRVGLFGGSFDPVHHGHLIVAQALLEQLGLDQLRFVPAREQPFKRGTHAASAEHRCRMVALAIEGEPRFQLEPIELERPGPSYTVDTLRALTTREPGVEFTLLVGSDAVQDLDKWHQAPELAKLARIVAFGRSGSPVIPSPLVSATVTVPELEISATDLRMRLKSGRSIRYRVPEPVVQYIRQNRLYL